MSTAPITSHSALRIVENERFKRLRVQHQRILSLHLKGWSTDSIAQSTKNPETYVRYVLGISKYKPLLAAAYETRIEQLMPKAIDALERNMQCGEPSAEIRAADVAFKANGRYEQVVDKGITAENVIERILEKISPDGTTTRAIERRIVNLGGLTSALPASD